MADKQIKLDGRFIPMGEAIKAGLVSEKDIDVLSKQIIDYKNLCENYNKEVGCFGTFDGSCIKEQCFTYKLLQQLQAKEQECEELKGLNTRLDNQREAYWKEYQKLKATLTEIKFWARELLKRTGQVVPYEIKQILQKISECEGNDEM